VSGYSWVTEGRTRHYVDGEGNILATLTPHSVYVGLYDTVFADHEKLEPLNLTRAAENVVTYCAKQGACLAAEAKKNSRNRRG
jgi:hypothetical protein